MPPAPHPALPSPKVTLPSSTKPLKRRPIRGLDVDVLVEHFHANAFSRHRHAQWQLMVIPAPASGCMQWRDKDRNDHREEITGSQVWIVPPGIFHTVQWADPVDVIKLYVDEPRASSALAFLVFDAVVYSLAEPVQSRPVITDLCHRLRSYAAQPNGPTDWIVACIGSHLAAELLEARSESTTHALFPEMYLVEQATQRLTASITKGLPGHPPFARIARELDVSPRQLQRAFQKVVFMPPRAWARARRAQHARDLLARGHSVKEVIVRSGYSDSSHLNRALRSEFGLTAAAIRTAGHKQRSLSSGKA